MGLIVGESLSCVALVGEVVGAGFRRLVKVDVLVMFESDLAEVLLFLLLSLALLPGFFG